MGRREDVLHGEFVHNEQPAEFASAPAIPPASAESLQLMLATIKKELRDAAQL
jgi:hypothetical protein